MIITVTSKTKNMTITIYYCIFLYLKKKAVVEIITTRNKKSVMT